MSKVNLDALIQREDFEVADDFKRDLGKKTDTIKLEDLRKNAWVYNALRKPDFQRETNEWDAEKIKELIMSFIEGDLIPAIILWQSKGSNIFVIDGSHRLSALAAWINDDYGDGIISRNFYEGEIPEEQKAIAQKTRKLINKEIGPYEDYVLAVTNPEKVAQQIRDKIRSLGVQAIQLQWVEGDSEKAEDSFFKINQQASPIDKTELKILRSRKKPNSIASRAVIRSGKGHKYWSEFSEITQNKIEDVAKQINDLLFEPEHKTPIKTLDLPIGGKECSNQTLSLVLNFINICNKIPLENDNLDDDCSGELTYQYLQESLRIAHKINSIKPSSLGLHPAVYLYSTENGKFKIASFYAIALLMKEMANIKDINAFIDVRGKFEDMLIKYDVLIQQISRRYRSADIAYVYIKDYFQDTINELREHNLDIPSVVQSILNMPKYSYLQLSQNDMRQIGSDFSSDSKSVIFIKEALKNAPKCKICGGYLHKHSITIDHIIRKQDGGNNEIDNGQLAHPYCNSTYKH